MAATKIFITDDHYLIIEGIRSLFLGDETLEWTGHATNAESCLAFLVQQQPDVILMDINLPGKSGIELCKEVKSLYPAIQIIALSSFNQQSFIKKMMDNGASGYVLKNATKEELTEAIVTVMSGEVFMSKEALLTIEKAKDAGVPVITKREKEVLILISDGLTNQEIADKIFVSVTTVDTHRKNLLSKFAAKNTATLIKLASQFEFI